jgi:hypothetical protein
VLLSLEEDEDERNGEEKEGEDERAWELVKKSTSSYEVLGKWFPHHLIHAGLSVI